MIKEILNIYNTEVTVLRFEKDEDHLEHISINENRDGEFMPILRDGDIATDNRELLSFFAIGQTEEFDMIVLAKDINAKQLGNIFLAYGVDGKVNASVTDLSNIVFKEEEPAVEDIVMEHIYTVGITYDEQDKPDQIISGHTISMEDVMQEVNVVDSGKVTGSLSLNTLNKVFQPEVKKAKKRRK